MIECVSLKNNHLFYGNPIYEQHLLRYRSVVDRQGWNVPTIENMEYDSYDNPAAWYLIWRDKKGIARGVSRLYPTDRPYMLQQSFPYLVTKRALPESIHVWEGSRFCIDKGLDPILRKKVMQELVIAYLEFSLSKNIHNIIGVMLPVYWRNIFIKSGWPVDFIGDIDRSNEGHKILAGSLPVSEEILQNVRQKTAIEYRVINFGEAKKSLQAA